MAIPVCNIGIVSRGSGGSAVERAAYISGAAFSSEYDGKTYDHTPKEWEVIHKEVLAPEHTPDWVYDPATLTNAIEQAERQKNAQLVRTIWIALPRELTPEQNIQLAREYAHTFVSEEGMITLWAVHDKKDGNIHAHFLFPTRSLNQDGTWKPKAKKVYILDENGEKIKLKSGAYKSYKERTVDWDNRYNAEKWRQWYQKSENQSLERSGLDVRIDVRSYERQGLDIIPTLYLERAEYEMVKRGKHTLKGEKNRDIREANMLRQAFKLAQVLKSIAEKRAQQEIEREVEKQREELATRTEKCASVRASGWKMQVGKDWQTTRKLRSEHKGDNGNRLTQGARKAERASEASRVHWREILQHTQEATRTEKHASVERSGWKSQKSRWQDLRAQLETLLEPKPKESFDTFHHDRISREEKWSRHYAESVRIIHEKRKLYDERNQGVRNREYSPERAYAPWQAELIERSQEVEYEKGQPSYVNARLVSNPRSPQPEYSQPHHERISREEEQSHHYAENVRIIHEKRKLYDERNLDRRNREYSPERAYAPWQAELIKRSLQIEYEKVQPSYVNALLFSKGTATRSLQLQLEELGKKETQKTGVIQHLGTQLERKAEPEISHHDRISREEKWSHHYAESVRIIHEKRKLYDERNQGVRNREYSPERAYAPWQAELIERSQEVEYEKGQPSYVNALLFSKGTATRSPQAKPHHERTRNDEERSRHYAENVRFVHEKRRLYDERNQERRRENYSPERAFEPWQAEIIKQSLQMEYEKAQPSYRNTLLLSQGTVTRSPQPAYSQPHHERIMRGEERICHYAESVRIIHEKRSLYDERNQEIRRGNYSPERAYAPWQAELIERSLQIEYEKGQPSYRNTRLVSQGTATRPPKLQHQLPAELVKQETQMLEVLQERTITREARNSIAPPGGEQERETLRLEVIKQQQIERQVHLRTIGTTLSTARNTLLRLQGRLAQVGKEQLAPLVKQEVLQRQFLRVEKILAQQASLLEAIQQKVTAAEEKHRPSPIPESIHRAIGDLLIREEKKQQAAFHRLEEDQRRERTFENQPPATHIRRKDRRMVQKGQEKGHSP